MIAANRLYWAAVATEDEARYLTAVLNAPVTTERVNPIRGQRDFHKYVWSLPIPAFESSDSQHKLLVALCAEAEQVVQATSLMNLGLIAARSKARDALEAVGLTQRINAAVLDLLAS